MSTGLGMSIGSSSGEAMDHPPFKTTRLASSLAAFRSIPAQPEEDVAGRDADEPVALGASTSADVPRAGARGRLADLDPQLHCSIIGTCLGAQDLRPLLVRFSGADFARASELELHHAAVELAAEGRDGAKALQKLLDQRYASALLRARHARNDSELQELWDAALKAGDIPGAYWAVMTHPRATSQLRKVAFGEVHMLSHLVGAANRADIRRLIALERDNAELKDKVRRQEARLREDGVGRHQMAVDLSNQVADLTLRLQRQSAGAAVDGVTELARTREALREREDHAALQDSRREEAERKLAVCREDLRRLQAQRDAAVALEQALQGEVRALERQLDAPGDEGGQLAAFAGRRLLYVGGRPGSNAAIRALCERAGLELALHDGGIEDRKGLLSAAIPGAELVLFPVDCVDHDSVGRLKRLCERHGVAYLPLRSAGAASFLAALAGRGARDAPTSAGRPSRFCLRHG